MNLQDVSYEIAKLVDKENDVEFLFKVQAMIKRHVHEEKASLCHRIWMAGRDAPKFGSDMAYGKFEQHEAMAKMSDEELITWEVRPYQSVSPNNVQV